MTSGGNQKCEEKFNAQMKHFITVIKLFSYFSWSTPTHVFNVR